MPGPPSFIAINVGNSRTRLGRFATGELDATEVRENANLADLVGIVSRWHGELSDRGRIDLVMASVNDAVAGRLASALKDQLSVEVFRVGVDLPVPIETRLDPETITGVDRLLNAAAAYETIRQACIVVDVGTAVTVDFVDGRGTFHGGAIAPGAQLQLSSLHEGTAALPDLEFRPPDDDAFGRSTAEAMLRGVFHGIRGMIRAVVERYAEHYGAYPIVVATGGDAAALLGDDQLIDRVVPDLTLYGIGMTVRHALSTDGADADLRR